MEKHPPLLDSSPPRKCKPHQEARHDKGKENGKTVELGEWDNMRQFQAQQAKCNEKTHTSGSNERSRWFHWWLLSSISPVYNFRGWILHYGLVPLPHRWEALEVEGLPVLYRMGEQGEQTAPVCCRKKRVCLDEAHSRRKRDLNSGFRIFQQTGAFCVAGKVELWDKIKKKALGSE